MLTMIIPIPVKCSWQYSDKGWMSTMYESTGQGGDSPHGWWAHFEWERSRTGSSKNVLDLKFGWGWVLTRSQLFVFPAEKRTRGNDSVSSPFFSCQTVINFDGLSKSRIKVEISVPRLPRPALAAFLTVGLVHAREMCIHRNMGGCKGWQGR